MPWTQAHVWGHVTIFARLQARIVQNLLGAQGVGSSVLHGYPGEDGDTPISRSWASEPALWPAAASSESFGILSWPDSVPGSFTDGTHSWQDTGAEGSARPIVPEHVVHCSAGTRSRHSLESHGWVHEMHSMCVPSTNNLAKSEPGQHVLKVCRRRVRHFSFVLGTDRFNFVSQ